MRKTLLALSLLSLLLALGELASAFGGRPVLFGTPWFFAMHGATVASLIAAACYAPRGTVQGGTLLLNRLKPFLPLFAYRTLIALFASGLCLFLAVILRGLDSVSPAVYFAGFWVFGLASSSILLRYVHPSRDAGA